MSVVVGMIVWTILGLQYQTLLVDGSLTLFVGRYAPVVLPPLGLLLAMGLERLIPARVRRGAVVVILAGLLAYNLSVMHAVSVIQ